MDFPQREAVMGLARKWARLGGWLGIAWPCLFVAVMIAAEMIGPKTHSAAEDLVALANPHNRRIDMLLHTLGGIVGLLGIGWCLGLNEWLQAERPSLASKLAVTFGIVGFSIATAMLIVQGSVQAGIGQHFASLTSDAEKSAAVPMLRNLRLVDLGLDFTWDIFISWTIILFGAAMLRSRHFGKIWGLTGIAISAFLFSLDVWSAPEPAEPDLSFLALIWVVAVGIQMIRSSKLVAGAGVSSSA
jgi:hypothetical protein